MEKRTIRKTSDETRPISQQQLGIENNYLRRYIQKKQESDERFQTAEIRLSLECDKIKRIPMNNWNTCQKEIKDLGEALLDQDENIKRLQDKVSKKQKNVETFENMKKVLEEYACDKEKLYFNMQEEHKSINEEIIRLEKEYDASIKKYESLETKMNDLNSKIEITREEREKLTSHLSKALLDHKKSQEEYNNLFKDIETQIDSQSKNLDDLQKEIQNALHHQIKLQKEINSYKKDIFTKKKIKAAFEKESGEIKALEQATQEIREKERQLTELQKKKKVAEQAMLGKQKWIKQLKEEAIFLGKTIEIVIHNNTGRTNHTKLVEIFENMFSTVEQKSTLVENDLKDLQKEIDNYDRILKQENSIMQAHVKNNTGIHNLSNFNRFKENDLAPFEGSLRVIKKYSEDNNIKELYNSINSLNDINRKLQDSKNRFEELEEANRIDKEDIAQRQFEHELYLKERKAIILDYGLNDGNLQALEHADSYREINIQNLELIQEKRSEISKAIIEFDQRVHITQKKLSKLVKDDDKLNRLMDQLIEMSPAGNLKDEKEKQLLGKYSERKQEYIQELPKLGKQLLQNKDEKARNILDYLTVSKKICDYRSIEIDAYQSELESLQTRKSNLKTRIDTELTKIRSQFETDLQNLQKSYNEKTSELESLQSKLTALEKSVQQETKRQELQDQLDKLASQIDTTHFGRETIAQKLEGHCQELEELRKALADAEQEKMLLGTRLKESKNKSEEKEKQLKRAEAEWEEKSMAAENARGLLEKFIIKKDRQEKALAKAEEEKRVLEAQYCDSKKRLMYLEKFMQRLNTHLYGKDSFTEGLSPNQWLMQAQEEVKKARTELLNARIDVSDAVITKSRPVRQT